MHEREIRSQGIRCERRARRKKAHARMALTELASEDVLSSVAGRARSVKLRVGHGARAPRLSRSSLARARASGFAGPRAPTPRLAFSGRRRRTHIHSHPARPARVFSQNPCATETATETAGRARAVRRKLKKPRALPPGGETSERARAAPDDAESNHLDKGVERPADGGQIGSKSKK